MITECEIKEFLYGIDEPLGVENWASYQTNKSLICQDKYLETERN